MRHARSAVRNQPPVARSVKMCKVHFGIRVWLPHTAVKLDVLRRPFGAVTALNRLISCTRRQSAPWAE
jgi:hypothetical protein